MSAKTAVKNETCEQLLVLLYNTDVPNKARYIINGIHRDDSSTIQFAINLIEQGKGGNAAYLVRSTFDVLIDEIDLAQQRFLEDEWKRVTGYSPQYLRERLAGAWGVGVIMDETGIDTDPTVAENRVSMLDTTYRFSGEDYSDNRSYWRGMGIIALSNIDSLTVVRGIDKFAHWAGSYPDSSRLIDLVNERVILDTETLQAIIREQDNMAASVREGAL